MKINQINPTEKQMKELANFPENTPLCMVNIVKFKKNSGNGNESGQDAYARYFKEVQPFIAKAGVKLIWKGKVASTVIGESENEPNLIFIAEYPSKAKFFEMVTNPAYKKVASIRAMAIEYGELIACVNDM